MPSIVETHVVRTIVSGLLLVLYSYTSATESSLSAHEITVTAHDGTELSLNHYPAKGDFVLVWVASSYSLNERIFALFQTLSRNSIETWQVDFADALFQTRSSNQLRNLDARYVSDIVTTAHERTKKKVILMARAYGAIPVLRGATIWQQKNPDSNYLAGVVLFSPDLYMAIPELGVDPEYVPVTSATGIPIMIYQAQSRGTGWQLPRLLKRLRENNPHVYFKLMPGVSGIFYHKDKATITKQYYDNLPTELPAVFRLLERSPATAPAKDYKYSQTSSNALMNTKLKPFRGGTRALPVSLKDIHGTPVILDNYKGKVTIVNFWATWCPPCVHEIPSLNRLRAKMQGKNFRLVSINYAETPERVNDFMQRVNVEFPVLMDIDSKVSARWNVIAFPSTFVVGPDGKIQYGVNAAIEWDSPEVIKLLNSLH